jgi:hypothetical protein
LNERKRERERGRERKREKKRERVVWEVALWWFEAIESGRVR